MLVLGLVVILWLGASQGNAATTSDFSGTTAITPEGSYVDQLQHRKKYTKHNVQTTAGDVTLAQDDAGNYVNSGSLKRKNGILNQQYYYFEAAALTVEADTPESTAIDLYVRTIDPERPGGVHMNYTTWTKVEPGEKINIGYFSYGSTSYRDSNFLRWKAVLRTDDNTVTPTLHSVTMTYYNATPDVNPITLLQNTFGLNRTAGATITVTIYGEGFQSGKEQVYLKNLYAANNVNVINSTTLVAELPIENLSTGSYTVVVQNTDTGRIGLTDSNGYAVHDFHGEPDPAHLRLIIKWYPPEISSFTPTTVSYNNGGTITIRGNYFSYGTTVSIDDKVMPADSVMVVNDHAITVDLTSGIITQYMLARNTNLTMLVTTPDYQTDSVDGLMIQ